MRDISIFKSPAHNLYNPKNRYDFLITSVLATKLWSIVETIVLMYVNIKCTNIFVTLLIYLKTNKIFIISYYCMKTHKQIIKNSIQIHKLKDKRQLIRKWDRWKKDNYINKSITNTMWERIVPNEKKTNNNNKKQQLNHRATKYLLPHIVQ